MNTRGVEEHLSEHPADEDEPITEEWLEEYGFELKYSSSGQLFSLWILRAEDGGSISVSTTTVPTEWMWRYCGVSVPTQTTRGQLRRLCAALNIELKEEGRGNY